MRFLPGDNVLQYVVAIRILPVVIRRIQIEDIPLYPANEAVQIFIETFIAAPIIYLYPGYLEAQSLLHVGFDPVSAVLIIATLAEMF